jgi:hypothetical protein
MITIIKKGENKQSIIRLLNELKQKSHNTGFDAYKYCGVIRFEKSPIEIQKSMRDEWK